MIQANYLLVKAEGAFIKIKAKLELGKGLDSLRTEILDSQMASLPISTTGIDTDEFWASSHTIRTVDTNQPVDSTLLNLIPALLTLPASNANSERCFSKV